MKTKLLLLTFIILLGILSSGCTIMESNINKIQTQSNIDPELQPYYDEFKRIRMKLGFDSPLPPIDIELNEVDNDNWKGQCNTIYWEDSTVIIARKVIISREVYDKSMNEVDTDYHKGIEQLMFHEFAHCFWDIDHNEKKYPRVITYTFDEIVGGGTAQHEVLCPDLMYPSGSWSSQSVSYLCYTQHYDLYLEQLYDIMLLDDFI